MNRYELALSNGFAGHDVLWIHFNELSDDDAKAAAVCRIRDAMRMAPGLTRATLYTKQEAMNKFVRSWTMEMVPDIRTTMGEN